MTTVAAIIRRAYRESNLLGINAQLTAEQETEGLDLLNGLIPATIGQEVGGVLRDLAIGGEYDRSAVTSDWVPENARLILNLNGAYTFRLHPNPYEGQRLALADVAGNLATYNVVLDGNGRKIEGAPSLTLSTNGQMSEWLYRADLADWVKIATLATTDQMPFPVEFDDYFRILLAMRLNPAYGQQIQIDSATWLQAQATRLQARYRRPRDLQDWGTYGLLNQHERHFGISNAAFNRGRVR